MDRENIQSIIKALRTERPVGVLYAGETKVADYEFASIEVMLKENADFLYITGSIDKVEAPSQPLDDVRLEFDMGEDEPLVFYGLRMATIEANGRARDVNAGYKLTGVRTGGVFAVGDYFDILDALSDKKLIPDAGFEILDANIPDGEVQIVTPGVVAVEADAPNEEAVA